MTIRHDLENVAVGKMPTGNQGFDELVAGGFPSSRTSLIASVPGLG